MPAGTRTLVHLSSDRSIQAGGPAGGVLDLDPPMMLWGSGMPGLVYLPPVFKCFVATNAGNFYGGSMMRSSTGFGYSMLTHSTP